MLSSRASVILCEVLQKYWSLSVAKSTFLLATLGRKETPSMPESVCLTMHDMDCHVNGRILYQTLLLVSANEPRMQLRAPTCFSGVFT